MYLLVHQSQCFSCLFKYLLPFFLTLLHYGWGRHLMHMYISSLHAGKFSWFFAVCWFFFSKLLFSKNSFRNIIRVTTGCIQIRPDVTSGLIWVRTVCKGDQQMTVWSLVGKELQVPKILKKITKVESVINPYKEATFAADKFCCFLRKPNKVGNSREMSRFYIKKM